MDLNQEAETTGLGSDIYYDRPLEDPQAPAPAAGDEGAHLDDQLEDQNEEPSSAFSSSFDEYPDLESTTAHILTPETFSEVQAEQAQFQASETPQPPASHFSSACDLESQGNISEQHTGHDAMDRPWTWSELFWDEAQETYRRPRDHGVIPTPRCRDSPWMRDISNTRWDKEPRSPHDGPHAPRIPSPLNPHQLKTLAIRFPETPDVQSQELSYSDEASEDSLSDESYPGANEDDALDYCVGLQPPGAVDANAIGETVDTRDEPPKYSFDALESLTRKHASWGDLDDDSDFFLESLKTIQTPGDSDTVPHQEDGLAEESCSSDDGSQCAITSEVKTESTPEKEKTHPLTTHEDLDISIDSDQELEHASIDGDQELEHATGMDRNEGFHAYNEYVYRSHLTDTKDEAMECLKKNRSLLSFEIEGEANAALQQGRSPQRPRQLPEDPDERNRLSRVLAHRYKEESEQREAERDFAKSAYIQAALELDKLKKQRDELLYGEQIMQEDLQDHQDALSAKRDSLDAAKQKISVLEESLKKRCQCTKSSDVAPMDDVVELIGTERSFTCDQCHKHILTIQELEATVESLGEKWLQEQDANDDLKSTVKAQKTTISDLKRERDDMQNERDKARYVSDCEVHPSAALPQTDTLHSEIVTQSESIVNWEKKCATLRDEIAKAEKLFEEEQGKVEQLRAQLDQANTKLNEASDRINERESQLRGSMSADLAGEPLTGHDLMNANTECSDNTEIQQAGADCQQKCKALQAELDTAEAILKGFREKSQQQANEIEELKQALRCSEADENLKSQYRKLQEDHEQLKNKLNAATQARDDLRRLLIKQVRVDDVNKGEAFTWHIGPHIVQELVEVLVDWVNHTDKLERSVANDSPLTGDQLNAIFGEGQTTFNAVATTLLEAGFLFREHRLAERVEEFYRNQPDPTVPSAILFASRRLDVSAGAIEQLLNELNERYLDVSELRRQAERAQSQQHIAVDSATQVTIAADEARLEDQRMVMQVLQTLELRNEQLQALQAKDQSSSTQLAELYAEQTRLNQQIADLQTLLRPSTHPAEAKSISTQTHSEDNDGFSAPHAPHSTSVLSAQHEIEFASQHQSTTIATLQDRLAQYEATLREFQHALDEKDAALAQLEDAARESSDRDIKNSNSNSDDDFNEVDNANDDASGRSSSSNSTTSRPRIGSLTSQHRLERRAEDEELRRTQAMFEALAGRPFVRWTKERRDQFFGFREGGVGGLVAGARARAGAGGSGSGGVGGRVCFAPVG